MKIRNPILLVLVTVATATLAVAAMAEEPIKIKMTTTWPSGINLIDVDKHFVGTVNELSGGRLKINFYPGGALVPSGQVFDAVRSGSIDASADWPSYWAGQNSAFALLGSYPMLLTAGDYILWLQQWGGFQKYQKVYGKFGMVYLPYAVFTMESGIRSSEPLTSLADLDGKRLRVAGRPQGEILKALGATQVQLPGSQVYQALDRGVVDGAEFAVPGIDWSMGLQEVTDNWLVPGWHQPGSITGVMINKKTWDKLGPELQNLMKTAAKATMLWSLAYYEKSAAEATEKFTESGTDVHSLSGKEMDRLQQLANGFLVKASCSNPLYAEIAYSQLQFLQEYSSWRKLQGAFAFGRNLPSLPNIEKIRSCMKQQDEE